VSSQPRELDFITKLANAWDGRGPCALQAAEKRALWELARLERFPREDLTPLWATLEPRNRQLLVAAARAAVNLGRVIALEVFGI
jgi:hypothetical protein